MRTCIGAWHDHERTHTCGARAQRDDARAHLRAVERAASARLQLREAEHLEQQLHAIACALRL